MADVRRAVRELLEERALPEGSLVLVALSGGPDSLALAAATAFEAPRAGLRAGAVVVDHGLQEGSAEVAERAAGQARELGLDPVRVRRMPPSDGARTGSLEAFARRGRYREIEAVVAETGARGALLGHTRDDQAETVLLGLLRGTGPAGLGMDRVAGLRWRPLLGIPRAATVQACADQGLEPWDDPHNLERRFMRARVRHEVMPVLVRELGEQIPASLARAAELLGEDAEALDAMAEEVMEDLVELEEAGLSIGAAALAANPAALRQRIIRRAVEAEFHVALSRAQTLEIARLATGWHGQGRLDLPGFTAERSGGRIHLISSTSGELTGVRPPHDH
ncbi:tRNA lysidine(34) synthetase TilS [Homoserinibacter sp. YIM 151385]|uniref:tRNA lysidine(34) synthetase TilS n=1 Tax=Homoserinibacter sp. YIM 151385 TaxID=2985506 RepID=UPI0022F1016C|nr:tRNA lysidine(34) synthetase TilS [Homoserinibacter sp. YIM 151385]WBU39407.1 tRNA lysidine(34) synthetase TilS [Homoserinibacter sp. YIM 151385]